MKGIFELAIAVRYLVPRRHSLSTALISVLSVAVISIVVWLVLVFLSVTSGMEQNWIEKLTSLHAPFRITPTAEYYNSYYYQIDSLSAASNYCLKSIGEKASTDCSDPYSEQDDPQLPLYWPSPLRHLDGRLRDPVKELFPILRDLNFAFQDYEIGGALFRVNIAKSGSVLSQASYLMSLPNQSPQFASLILPPSLEDVERLLKNASGNTPQLASILENITICKALINMPQDTLGSYPPSDKVEVEFIKFVGFNEKNSPLFEISSPIDSQNLISLEKLNLTDIECKTKFKIMPQSPPPWAISVGGFCHFPKSIPRFQPCLVPKAYYDKGMRIGDQGSLNFVGLSSTMTEEQSIPVQVCGFYDPGLFSLGGSCLIVSPEVTRTVRSLSPVLSTDSNPTNGIFLWNRTNQDIDFLKRQIEENLKTGELSSYWQVATYKDFEFSKELFQQFRSDRTLFLLIAFLILLVASCNIISLLVLLVNDKKKEIAILQAMGASRTSIALIFSFCGLVIGSFSSACGTLGALFTLRHLDVIVAFLSSLQGHTAFQPAFFGSSLPNQINGEALVFVLVMAPLLSLLAGLIPALRASRICPSITLRQA